MKKIMIELLAGTLMLTAVGGIANTSNVSADNVNTSTKSVDTNSIVFMIKGNAPVYSASGMDLKMLAPISNKSYVVSTKDIIKLSDGVYLYPINNENQYVKSTDVVQAVNDDNTAQWTTSPLDTVINTKNLVGIPLYDENGNIIEKRALGANTAWYTNGTKTNVKTGEVFYRVSTHEYVSADDII